MEAMQFPAMSSPVSIAGVTKLQTVNHAPDTTLAFAIARNRAKQPFPSRQPEKPPAVRLTQKDMNRNNV